MTPPTPSRLVPDARLADVAERFRLLAVPARLELLNCLQQSGELAVQDLVRATGQRQASVSKHLARLAAGGVVGRRRAGQRVLYRIADPNLPAVCTLMCGGPERASGVPRRQAAERMETTLS